MVSGRQENHQKKEEVEKEMKERKKNEKGKGI